MSGDPVAEYLQKYGSGTPAPRPRPDSGEDPVAAYLKRYGGAAQAQAHPQPLQPETPAEAPAARALSTGIPTTPRPMARDATAQPPRAATPAAPQAAPQAKPPAKRDAPAPAIADRAEGVGVAAVQGAAQVATGTVKGALISGAARYREDDAPQSYVGRLLSGEAKREDAPHSVFANPLRPRLTYLERLRRPAEELAAMDETPLFRAADRVQRAAEGLSGRVHPELKDSFWNTRVPNALGQFGGQVAATVASPQAGYGSAVFMGAAEAYERARAAGADEATALKASRLGEMLGASEMLPIGTLLRRAKEVVPPGALARVLHVLGSGAREGIEEGAQEAASQVGYNLVQRTLVDPAQSLTEGVIEGGQVGGAAGAVAGLIAGALPGRQHGTSSVQPEASQESAAGGSAPGFRQRIADALDPARAERLRELEEHRATAERNTEVDIRTGLANDRAFFRAQPAADADPSQAYAVFDVVGLKAANDLVSASKGDEIIQRAARAIAQAAEEIVGSSQDAYRQGGDEFAFIGTPQQTVAVLERARELMGVERIGESAFAARLRGAVGSTYEEADAGVRAAKANETGPKYRSLAPAQAPAGPELPGGVRRVSSTKTRPVPVVEPAAADPALPMEPARGDPRAGWRRSPLLAALGAGRKIEGARAGAPASTGTGEAPEQVGEQALVQAEPTAATNPASHPGSSPAEASPPAVDPAALDTRVAEPGVPTADPAAPGDDPVDLFGESRPAAVEQGALFTARELAPGEVAEAERISGRKMNAEEVAAATRQLRAEADSREPADSGTGDLFGERRHGREADTATYRRSLGAAKALSDDKLLSRYRASLRSAIVAGARAREVDGQGVRLKRDYADPALAIGTVGTGAGSFARGSETQANARLAAYEDEIRRRGLVAPHPDQAFDDATGQDVPEPLREEFRSLRALDDETLFERVGLAEEQASQDPGSPIAAVRRAFYAGELRRRGLDDVVEATTAGEWYAPEDAGATGRAPRVRITGAEFGTSEDVDVLRPAAQAFAERNLRGRRFVNRQTGWEIGITAEGLRESFSYSAKPEKVRSFAALGSATGDRRVARVGGEP